jgi:hypothetical protein
MQPGFEGRAEYLSLALFAQNLVSELADFSKHGDATRLVPSLEEALKSLEDVRSDDVKKFGRQDAVAFNSYQQLSALRKAWSADDLDHAIRLTRELLVNPNELTAKTQLIDLFERLQVQALWSFELPETPPTEGLRQLCRMTP